MKRLIVLTLLFLQAVCFCVSASAENVRQNILFNFGWKFHFGDAQGAEAIGFNDAGCRTLDLPHDFQIEQPWTKSGGSMRGYKPLGTGWYRKTFEADT